MKWSRREFIRNSAFAAAGMSLSSPLLAAVKPKMKVPAANEKVVVVINQFGGNDGVNTVIPLSPTEYDQYRVLRPVLGYDQADILTLNGTPDFGLNPGLTGFQSLYNQGKMAVVTGVGVPDTAVGLFDHEAGQYEFQSCDIVRSGAIQPSGWLGRYLDSVPPGPGQVSPGLDMGGGRLLVTGLSQQPVSLYTIDDFALQVSSWGDDENARRAAYQNIMGVPIGDSPVAEQNRLYRQDALNQSAIIQNAVAGYNPTVTYPDTWLGYQLRECARVIFGNVGVRALTVGTGGYDTHSGQDSGKDATTLGYHAGLLKDVGDAVSALYQDLVNQGLSNRVLILTISEFGRRAYQNTDDGTDHGFGSVAFAVGDMVNGGNIYGTYPSLQDQFLVFDGNVDVTTDFRSFYATVAANFLGVDPVPIVGGSFPLLGFV